MDNLTSGNDGDSLKPFNGTLVVAVLGAVFLVAAVAVMAHYSQVQCCMYMCCVLPQ